METGNWYSSAINLPVFKIYLNTLQGNEVNAGLYNAFYI